MRRDRMTFGLMIGVPLMQLLLFGFAINTDPRHLPTVVHIADDSVYARSIAAALTNSEYFDIVATARTPQEAERMLDEGEVAFAITVPVNFARDLVRGQTPQLLIQADASDPAASSIALATISELATSALKDDLVGPLASRASQAGVHHGDPAALQSRGDHAIQYRAGADRRHPHHDDGDGDRHGDDARAREGHVREPARDAGEPVRSDDRQDHAVCRGRLHPGDADHPGRVLSCSTCR